MHEFRYCRGRLVCEGTDLEMLARRYGTPLYVYSQATLASHCRRLMAALHPLDTLLCYAMKANSNLAVLSRLARLGSGFDTVSAGELYRALRAGGKASRCVFAGVGKTEAEIRYALRLGILAFHVESVAELRRIHAVAATLRRRAPVALRVNPDVVAGGHAKITTGTYENKFGIPWERALAIYEAAAKLSWIETVGVQMHIGSQITTVAPFAQAVRRLLPLVRALRDRFRIRYFSIGGGIGIVYRPALESGSPDWWRPGGARRAGRTALPLTIELYARTLVPLLRPLGMRILLEPGRFIVGNAGVLLTRVEYLKHLGRKNYVIVDAAMNDLLRPAFYDSYHQIVPLRERMPGRGTAVDVVGPVCESGDFLAKDRILPELQEGDHLAVMSAGAYGFTMASNYNSRPRPAEVLVHGKRSLLVRRRETFADLVRGERK
ncbi:MAG: diaminopimelate decarboxylase [Verrucomicrobiae bacterium]|nr:diaminopimelate decarboxylase [Verrucomicrobiae bacterium]